MNQRTIVSQALCQREYLGYRVAFLPRHFVVFLCLVIVELSPTLAKENKAKDGGREKRRQATSHGDDEETIIRKHLTPSPFSCSACGLVAASFVKAIEKPLRSTEFGSTLRKSQFDKGVNAFCSDTKFYPAQTSLVWVQDPRKNNPEEWLLDWKDKSHGLTKKGVKKGKEYNITQKGKRAQLILLESCRVHVLNNSEAIAEKYAMKREVKDIDWRFILCNEFAEVVNDTKWPVCDEELWPADFKKRKKEKRPEEIRDERKHQVVDHVICPVCQALVEATIDRVQMLGLNDGKPEAEEKLEDDLDKICMPMEPPGHWVTRFDFQRDCSECQIEVIWNKDSPAGKCSNECQVATRACTKALKGNEENLRDMVLAQKPKKEIQKVVCKKACKKKKLAPLEFWKDELFEERNRQEVEVQTIDRLLRNMPGVSTSIKTTDQYITEKAEDEQIHKVMPSEIKDEDEEDGEDDDEEDEADYSQKGGHEDL